MNILLKLIRNQLQSIINDIDVGNSDLSEEELIETMEVLRLYLDKDVPLTKYQSCEYIHVSRATFDNLVKDNKIPKGKKLYQGDSNLFWFKKDLDNYKLHCNGKV